MANGLSDRSEHARADRPPAVDGGPSRLLRTDRAGERAIGGVELRSARFAARYHRLTNGARWPPGAIAAPARGRRRMARFDSPRAPKPSHPPRHRASIKAPQPLPHLQGRAVRDDDEPDEKAEKQRAEPGHWRRTVGNAGRDSKANVWHRLSVGDRASEMRRRGASKKPVIQSGVPCGRWDGTQSKDLQYHPGVLRVLS